MNIFIFENVSQLTNNYHSEGGLVIVAENIEQAVKMVFEDKYIELTKEELENVKVFKLAYNHEPQMFVFPDAGCCG